MYLSATLATIAALSLLVEATPSLSRSGFAIPISKRTQVHDVNGVVDIARLERNVHRSIAKLHHGFRSYKRNTGSSHPFAPNVTFSEKRGIGSEPLVDPDWYGTISVGTPAKNFTVNFDTGSNDLFLPSSTCDSSCNGHVLYDASESSTAHDLGKLFSLRYTGGDGVSGMLFTDNVTIAGYMATNQTLGGGTSYSESFGFPRWLPDGLLGLGFPSISIYGAPSVFHTLVSQGSLPINSFGLCPSELYIGGTNDKLHKGDFTYVPLTHEGFWQTNFDGLYVNGQKIANTTNMIIDSGTSAIIGDSKTVQAMYDQIPGSFPIASLAGTYSIPCSFNSEIILQFGAANFTLQPHIFNLGSYDDACIGGITANDHASFWTLGDVFLKTVYTEFDVGNKRIGLATPA